MGGPEKDQVCVCRPGSPLSPLSAYSSCKLHISWHDGYSLSHIQIMLYSWYKLGMLVKPFIAVLMLYSEVVVLVLGENHI